MRKIVETEPETPDLQPPLSITAEQVCFVIGKVRELDAEDASSEPDAEESDLAIDDEIEVLEDHDDDPVVQELTGFIDLLSEDEQIDLIALALLGSNDGSVGDWADVREEAARAHSGDRTAAHLLGMPQLGDLLEQALSALGYSCEDLDEIGL